MGQHRPQLRRILKVWLTAASMGAVILGLTQYVLLPAVAQRLTPSQLMWLREAFQAHTAWFLLAILVLAAILGLPLLIVALWAARLGPWRENSPSVDR